MNFHTTTYQSVLSKVCLLILAAVIPVSPVTAQKPSDPPTNGVVANDNLQLKSEIDAFKKQLGSADLDPEKKKMVETVLNQATENFKQYQSLQTKITNFKQSTESLPERQKTLQKNKEEILEAPVVQPSFESLTEAEQALTQRQLKLAELKTEQSRIDAAPAARTARRTEIQNAVTLVEKRISEQKTTLDSTAVDQDQPLIPQAATRLELRTSLLVNEASLLALQSEKAFLDAEEAAGIVNLERDIQKEKVSRLEAEIQKIQADVERRRLSVGDRLLDQAKTLKSTAPAPLISLAEEIVTLATESQALNDPLRREQDRLESITQKLEALQKEFVDTKQRVTSVGSTYTVGNRLRRQKATLPNIQTLRNRIHNGRETIETAQEQWFNLDDQRADLANLDRAMDKYFDSLYPQISGANEKRLQPEAKTLLELKFEVLDHALRNYDTYLQTLASIESKVQLLIEETEAYRDFIDERVLWVRSNKSLFVNLNADESDTWIFDPGTYLDVLDRLKDDARNNIVLYIIVGILLIVWYARKSRIKYELESMGKTAQRGTCVSLNPTISALFCTLFLSLPVPLLIVFLAIRLNATAGDSSNVSSLAFALSAVAWGVFPLEFLNGACRRRGIVDAHFEWSSGIVKQIRQKSRWFILLGLPLVFVNMALYSVDDDYGHDLVERLCFCGVAILLAVFLQRVLRPMVLESQAKTRNGWNAYILPALFWVSVLIPVVFAGLAVFGYYYTALHLTWRLYNSVVTILVILLLQGILLRMVQLQRRNLFIERRKQRVEALQKTEPNAESVTPAVQEFVPEDELTADMKVSTQQSHRLIYSGLITVTIIALWMIWSDVLPALKILDHWKLWSITITETYESPTNPEEVLSRDIPRVVTIANVALSILVAFFTIVAATNIPGLMEIALLQRLPIDQSVRYAITRITSYIIALVGIILTFNAIAIGWSQVQWLATALTFGLAFGLQEIFANFVAGVILLFERPIRVGDVVTVDGVSGVVSRIRIRATTITNWDRQEYIIPNKEFITGRLLNWTLSDKINRIVINVGVAYGSNIELAVSILRRLCEEHPEVLDEPQTLITFEGFGDNTLNIVIRAYLPRLDRRLHTIHELHNSIDTEFKKAGIEIAFPQRDLHIRSIDPGVQKIFRGESDNAN